MSKHALIIAEPGVPERAVTYPRKVLQEHGYIVHLAAPQKGELTGDAGCRLRADLSLAGALGAVGAFDLIVLPPADSAASCLLRNRDVLDLLKLAEAQGKVIAAVCDGCALALRGLNLDGRIVAALPEHAEAVRGAHAVWDEAPVVTDGHLVTAAGREHLEELMAEALRLAA